MQLVWLPDTVTTDITRTFDLASLWGLEGVVLRDVGESHQRIPDIDESRLRHELQTHEIGLVAVEPGVFEGPLVDDHIWRNDVALLEEVGEFCQRFSCDVVLVSSFARDGATSDHEKVAHALRQAGEVCADYGLTLAVRNEPTTNCETADELAEVLNVADHPALRAAWNPYVDRSAGANVDEQFEYLADTIGFVSVIDYSLMGRVEDHIEWEDVLSRLMQHNYSGPLCLEVHMEPGPRVGLRASRQLIELRESVLGEV